MVWWKARWFKKRTRAAIEIQRVYRAYRVRTRVQVLREERLALLAKGSQAVPIQAIFRGFVTRKTDQLVRPAITGLREDRKQELQHAAAVRLETVVRAWIAHKRCAAWGEMKRQRMRDTDICSRRIQGVARCYLAHMWLAKLRLERETRCEIERRAAVQLQSFWRGCIGKQTGATVKSQIARIKRARHRTAIKLQAAYRGHRGRGDWRGAHRIWKRESRAARKIQKVFRGSRVMGWRDVRMNKVAQHVSMRQELEFQERLGSGKERYEQLAREANRDSCSEEEDEVDAIEQWEEVWEEDATHSYWWNAALRESSLVKPLAFEESLVGLRVWVTRPTPGGASGKANITRFHRKKTKHRLEFDAGGREWTNLEAEQDSLLVWVNSAWVQLKNYVEPAVAEARARKELLSRRRRANQHLFDREARWEQIHNETNGTLRYHDPQTGDILVALEGADMWTMEQDDVGDIIFVHRETQEVVYDDPRFEERSRKERARAKIKCMEEMRFAKYFCDDICARRDEYEEGLLSAKAKRVLLEALASGESALKMGSAIATARSVFRERELQENAELQEAMLLLKHMNDLKEWAHEEMQAALSHKTRFLTGGEESSLSSSKSSRSSRALASREATGTPAEDYQMGTYNNIDMGHDEGYGYTQDENAHQAGHQQQVLQGGGRDYYYDQQYYNQNDSTQQHAASQDWG